MNQNNVNYFLCIADQRSLTRAARSLFISQSALSQYLKKLEIDIGTQLFVRNGRELVLTEAGKIYYKGTTEIKYIYDHTVEEIHALNTSREISISIGVTGSNTLLFASRITDHLQKNYPDCQIRFVQDEMPQLCSMVKAQQLDCAIGAINFQTGVKQVNLSQHPLALFVSHHSSCFDQFQENQPINLIELKNHRFILLHSGTIHRRLIDVYFSENSFRPNIFAESRDYETIYNAVNNSDALTILATRCRNKMPDAKCFPLLNAPHYEIGIIFSERKPIRQYMSDFVKAAVAKRNYFE